ncbi:hypothetical protein DQQ10_26900 [Pseudochryseolinea flava]|uniref:Uncharacterized protein n=1 Tax=Pseudochryseolinea flava TaxID=2059302 RepID=A0A364XWA9_9BACT|nr:hypothetical protein DQQ10_26900 [Pseudochryseolinea flava]
MIQELEQEKANLKNLIDDAVKNGEYLTAHFHQEGIAIINKKLHTLNNLDDKNFDKKSLAEIFGIPTQDDDTFSTSREKETDALTESSILFEHLGELLSRKIKGINIVLKKSANLALRLSTDGAILKIEVSNVQALRKSMTITNHGLDHFIALGFTIEEGGDKLTFRQKHQDAETSLHEIQTIISKIVFDIFYFKEFRGETFLEIQV